MNIDREPQTVVATIRSVVVALATAWTVANGIPRATADEPGPHDYLERPGGPRVEGRLLLDAQTGFRFQTTGEAPGTGQAVEVGRVIEFAASDSTPTSIPPLFQANIGETARISGTLRRVTENAVVLSVPWQSQEVEVLRPGIQSLVQRFGEARVLVDSFEKPDPTTWAVVGKAEIVPGAGSSPDARALLLPPGGSSIAHRFEESLDSGRIDLTFHDDAKVYPGQRWTVELTFRGPSGPAVLRILLGWAEDSLAVESPEGPSLAVQRLARAEGWRRLTIRFSAERTEISVDGKELAHGRGPSGPLDSIRVATSGENAPGLGRGGLVGEVQAFRFTQPPTSLEIDPSQDEARLVVGDQFFGKVRQGDQERVEMLVDERPVLIAWEDLAGLYFQRTPAPGTPVRGALARVTWKTGEDDPARNTDFAEGAVQALTDASLTLATPYAGALTIPRDRLIQLLVLEPGLRLVLDPSAHHLGDEISITPPLLDPPLPEGGVLERSFDLPQNASGPAFLVLDVIQVVGEAQGLPFSEFVRRGELKTYAEFNGKRIDYLNRHIATTNETSERIRITIPADLLKPGRNQIRIVQTGIEKNPTWYDDLGILGVAVEFSGSAASADVSDQTNRPTP